MSVQTSSKTRAVPPGPPGQWLLGNWREFRHNPLDFLTTCAHKYGDVVCYRIARHSVYLLNRPDYVEQVLTVHNRQIVKGRALQVGRGLLGNRLEDIIYRVIHDRQAGEQGRGDLLSTLLQVPKDGGDRLTGRELRDEVMTLFLAGHATTAVALTWTWYLLATHPNVVAKLAAELHHVVGNRPSRSDDVPRLSYAEKVIKEAMRLFPPVWVITRVARQNFEVGAYPVGGLPMRVGEC